jgi:SAM-dependent methyltransferase
MATVDARHPGEGANPYALRGGEDAKRRLDLIAGVLRPSTLALLERAGIRAGDRCLDVGCGGGHVARELALPDPAGTLARMAACLKPGGKLVVEDIDHSGVVSEPPSPAYARYNEVYEELIGRRGGDPRIGLKLVRLLHQAGVGGVELHIVQPAFTAGPAKHVHVITLDSITDALQAEGMATAAEVAALRADMMRFGEAEDTIVTFPRIVQAWGTLT